MASLSHGVSLDYSSTVYASTLHALIESAVVANVSASDLIGGTHFISVGLTAPNPTNYPIWFSSDPADPVLRVWSPPFDIWLAAGPDRMEIPLKNASGGAVHKGALVCISSFSQFTVATHPSLNACGILQDTSASGAWSPVMIYGIGWASFQSSFSGVGGNNACIAGYYMQAFGNRAGHCHGVASANDGSAGSGIVYGIWLETRSTNGLARCLFWGPKATI